MKRAGIVAALLALLLAALWFKGGLVALPEVPARAAAGEFDTARALARLRADPRRPAAASGRQRGRTTRFASGCSPNCGRSASTPRVTDDVACNGTGKSRTVSCARVRNVVATIGPAAGRPVMMVSHYDSTPVGPGAADDGIGVAAMLEVAALLRDRPLERPVLLPVQRGRGNRPDRRPRLPRPRSARRGRSRPSSTSRRAA